MGTWPTQNASDGLYYSNDQGYTPFDTKYTEDGIRLYHHIWLLANLVGTGVVATPKSDPDPAKMAVLSQEGARPPNKTKGT